MEYAFDTNTIIHLLRGTRSVKENREKTYREGALFVIPPIVHYEIRRGLLIKPVPAYEKAYSIICDNCRLGEMTAAGWECAARIYAGLYAKHFTVNDADILIAAFCMSNSHTLVTDNTKDFENIDGIKVVNWVDRSIV
jgi:tRNA(fMet)-specific endonuclease VapC